MTSETATTTGASVTGRPVYLSLGGEPIFAMLHLPAGGSSRSGVLLCPPFGWEEMCSHRPLRAWAIALAEAGHAVARLDLPGTGDSAGGPHDPDRVGAWARAVVDGAAWLRDRSGAERLVVVGIALGGIVALEALSRGAPIDELVLWGVPAQGRRLIREMRALGQIVAGGGSTPSSKEGPSGELAVPPAPHEDDELELVGHVMSAQTVAALEALRVDAMELPRGRLRRALLLPRGGLSVDARLMRALEAAGASVETASGEEWDHLVDHPQEAVPPWATIQRTIDWLSSDPTPPPAPDAPRSGASAGRWDERPALELVQDGVALREVPLEISWRGQHLTGILTEAIGGEAQPVCAVLTGAGALRRIGPNRAWVESARRWAALGVPTARIDLIGIGDADGDDGPETRCNRALYASDRLEQTRTVLDALAERGLPDRFVVGGLCSGAYAAVHAAEVDERVVGTLLINLYAFEWSDELVRERQTTHTVSALHGRAWRKLFRRGLRRKQIVAALGSLRPDRLRVATGRPVERAQRTAVLRSLDRLRDRDVRTLLLLSDGEPLRDQLRRMGALHERQRWPNLRIERIPSRDHMFRARPLQRHVHSRLDATIAAIVAEQTTGLDTSSSLRTS